MISSSPSPSSFSSSSCVSFLFFYVDELYFYTLKLDFERFYVINLRVNLRVLGHLSTLSWWGPLIAGLSCYGVCAANSYSPGSPICGEFLAVVLPTLV